MNTLSYKGYTARMEFDMEAKILVGQVVNLVGQVVNIDDIIVFHGESVTEFETAFHEAIDGYIAACEKRGQAPEKPASGRMMLRIDPSVHAAALKSAARTGKSLNKRVEQVLKSELAASARDRS